MQWNADTTYYVSLTARQSGERFLIGTFATRNAAVEFARSIDPAIKGIEISTVTSPARFLKLIGEEYGRVFRSVEDLIAAESAVGKSLPDRLRDEFARNGITDGSPEVKDTWNKSNGTNQAWITDPERYVPPVVVPKVDQDELNDVSQAKAANLKKITDALDKLPPIPEYTSPKYDQPPGTFQIKYYPKDLSHPDTQTAIRNARVAGAKLGLGTHPDDKIVIHHEYGTSTTIPFMPRFVVKFDGEPVLHPKFAEKYVGIVDMTEADAKTLKDPEVIAAIKKQILENPNDLQVIPGGKLEVVYPEPYGLPIGHATEDTKYDPSILADSRPLDPLRDACDAVLDQVPGELSDKPKPTFMDLFDAHVKSDTGEIVLGGKYKDHEPVFDDSANPTKFKILPKLPEYTPGESMEMYNQRQHRRYHAARRVKWVENEKAKHEARVAKQETKSVSPANAVLTTPNPTDFHSLDRQIRRAEGVLENYDNLPRPLNAIATRDFLRDHLDRLYVLKRAEQAKKHQVFHSDLKAMTNPPKLYNNPAETNE